MSILKRFIFASLILLLSLWVLNSKPFNLGLDLKGGVSIVLEAQESQDRQITNDDMVGVMDVIRGRINALGLTEPIIQRKGINQVVVELPGISDIDRALSLIGETAQLTFHEAEWAPQNIDRLNEEENSLRLESEQIESKINDLEKQKDPKREILEKLRQKEQELISSSGSSIGQVQEIDGKLKNLTEKDMDLTKQINNFERQSDSLNRDLHDLIENEVKLQQILSAFGFDKDMETFDVEPIVQGLTSELTSLTALNAKAPETYLEVSYGYRSMSVRKNSLEEERNSIVKFIEDIEKDKRQTFLDAFDKVDKEIRSIFNKMTGGNAWLELQNEDDIFNSGISYLIQFPNKPKRESTSISGGEKTLAAIVFVLALQKLKPSPFYLFDEVDAHLDAPNSERLSNILEERSKESQFIMVSLKDSVIQKAKLIYGVFPKNGVSNVVTYKDKRVPSVNAANAP